MTWRAGYVRARRGRTYAGHLTRWEGGKVVESDRCPHQHRTSAAAQECADKALRRVESNGGRLL